MAGVRRAGGRFLLAARAGANAYFSAEGLAPAPALDAPPQGPAPPSSAAASRVTPAVLFVTVVLAVVLLVSGLLHVLRRLFLKTHHAGSGAGERHHLQHFFFPGNDDGSGAGGSGGGGGLAQAAIDALPEFAYAELSGAANAGSAAAASRKGKEKAARPFDCAVCLCEFAAHDRLRLLPPCGHAFHVACIDVWLRSSATCPLCRTKLSRAAAAPSVGNDDVAEEDESKQQQDHHQAPSAEPAGSSVVLPVRLGRFQIADADAAADPAAESSTGASGGRIDKRRCYSMGSYQYVLADEQLLVSVHLRHHGTAGAGAAAAGGSGDDHHQQQLGSRKVFARGDSFSVSKIWQWRGSRRLPGALCADDGLPWAPAAVKDGDGSTARQQHGDT